MTQTLAHIVSWYGTAAILCAYALSSLGWLKQNVWYQLLNLTGAAGVAFISLHEHVLQPAVLNIVWALVALAVLVKIWRQRYANTATRNVRSSQRLSG